MTAPDQTPDDRLPRGSWRWGLVVAWIALVLAVYWARSPFVERAWDLMF